MSTFVAKQIERFGARYATYRGDWERAERLEIVPEFPLYVMLEQTFKCNLRCPTCILGDTKQAKTWAAPYMKRPLYDRIIAECGAEGLPSIAMHSTDEPLLVKDIVSRVEAARDAGIMDIILSTNGHLLTRQKIADLICAGLTHLLFSIDAATEATYAKVRPGGGTLADVIRIIETVNELRGNSPVPRTRASFVVSSLNQHERRLFQEAFESLVDYIDFQTFAGFEENVSFAPIGAAFNDPKNFQCNSPFQRVVIRGNGDVLPCCSSYGYQLPLGNLKNGTIREIWTSHRAKQLREDFRANRYGEACTKCIEATGRLGPSVSAS